MVATAQRTDSATAGERPAAAGGGWARGKAPAKRTLNQNDFIHSLIREAVKGGLSTDDGRRLTFYEAKVVLVTAWGIAKDEKWDALPPIEAVAA